MIFGLIWASGAATEALQGGAEGHGARHVGINGRQTQTNPRVLIGFYKVLIGFYKVLIGF